MSLSVTRERRSNAGSKMASLLDSEEVFDKFYENIYGGFEEEENDIDYDSSDTDSEDIVDSDFSIDENDEVISDDQNDEELKPKSKTKFGSIKKQKPKNQKKPKSRSKINTENRIPLEVDIPSFDPIVSETIIRTFGKSFSTEKIIENRLKFAEEVTELDLKNNSKDRDLGQPLTQKELLEEAVITEKINIKSLKDWQNLELERVRKTKDVRHSLKVPFIRYQSVSMPLIEELEVSSSGDQSNDNKDTNEAIIGGKKYSRNFISFSEDKTYDSFVKSLSNKPKPSKDMVCAVTKMPARYFDPMTQLPFANTKAFNTIRSQYYNQLELIGNTDNEEVKQWIDWRVDNRNKLFELKPNSSFVNSDSTEIEEQSEEPQISQSQPIVPKVNTKRSISRSARKRRKK